MRPVAIRRPPRRQATSVEKHFPAPVGGWNARDSLAAMPAHDAWKLVNWFPRPSYVEMRPGHTAYHWNILGTIKTLAVYRDLDGTEEMYAYTDTGVYESTFGGDGASQVKIVTRTNGKHQWENFGDGTNNWLIAFNGVDKPIYYNGTTWTAIDGASTPAITGLTTTHIVSCGVFKERLLLIRNNKLGFDYLSANAVGGAATYFDLASIATKGGYLLAIAVWTRDAGSGPDDFCVFLTSQGEAIVYQGTDPSSASTWALVGTFQIAKPLGRRCVLKYGADPLILTESGLFPLSALLASGDERQKFAVSYKIEDAFSQAAASHFSTFGWKAISFPEQDALIVNVPLAEGGAHEQFVMNTISKAWCKFTGWHAEDWAVYNRELYFARGKSVFKAWTGTSDNGASITYEAAQAYQSFGTEAPKVPVQFMPLLQSNRLVSYSAGIDVDFQEREQTSSTAVSESTSGRWGVGQWGSAKWASSTNVIRQWGGTASWPGRWLSGKLKIVSDTVTAKWIGSVMRFIPGSGL